MEYNHKEPIFDFFRRSIELAEEFKDHKYNTTLQINLLLGTIVIPKANWYDQLQHESFHKSEIEGVEINYKSEHISLQVLLHCLRNAISHWREKGSDNLRFLNEENNESKEITKVTIKGDGKVDGEWEKIVVTFDLKSDGIIHLMKKVQAFLEKFKLH